MRLNMPFATTLLFCSLLLAASPACTETRPAAANPPTPATKAAAARDRGPARWEKDIAAYEAMDRVNPPPRGAVLFIGSSTIRLWKTLESDFPDHRVINRGFGGSQIADSTFFAERIIFPYEPRVVVLRAGGNDLHAGKTPAQVFADYQAFVARVHARLPQTRIVYIATNPTPARWAERDAARALNAMIEAYTRPRPYLKYVETYDMVLGPDGRPRPELFAPDRLHFSPEGYRLLTERVRPFLAE